MTVLRRHGVWTQWRASSVSVSTDTLETAELAPVLSATTLLNIVTVDYSVAICIYIYFYSINTRITTTTLLNSLNKKHSHGRL